jgi:DNA-binding beta-propeller fold protein YncE
MLGLVGAAASRTSRSGALTQPAGAAGCISEGGKAGCAKGRALDGADGVTVSPDGRNVYAASEESDSVVVLARDRRRGRVRQVSRSRGCISRARQGGCTRVRALGGAYVASESSGLVVFDR